MIIFLNGVSSSGKSTIAKALQDLYEKPILHLGIDCFFNMMPSKYIGFGAKADEGFKYEILERDRVRMVNGPLASQIIQSAVKVIRLMASEGYDIIIDEAILTPGRFEQYQAAFKDLDAYYIGITADPEILAQREILRPDRTIGIGKDQLERLQDLPYDLEIDTSNATPHACAKHILEFVTNKIAKAA